MIHYIEPRLFEISFGDPVLILQNIVFPKYGVCSIHDLYFRLKNRTDYSYNDQNITSGEGSTVCFDTYLNGFYINKWKKYTNVSEIHLTLRLKGKYRITLLHRERIANKQYKDTILYETAFSSKAEETVTLPFGDFTSGMFTFELLSLKDDSIFYGGYYSSDVSQDSIDDVKIGICICTFRREQYVIGNINRVLQSFLNDKDSILFDRLEVFISDNGGTIDPQTFEDPAVHIFNNKNVGGAGGFTRCLIEIQRRNSGITHAVLMDDDIVFDTESIFRTFALLSILKEEHKDAFVGGAMLSLDRQNIQIESGARWNQGSIVSLKKGLDLISCESCLYNDVEETTEYNAWWYCAVPVEKINENGLPIPIFFRGDDVEYGLRNIRELILMNGICVWHEPFENKYSSATYYYILRNRLIVNSVRKIDYTRKQLIKDFVRQWTTEITRFRYKNANLLVKGVEDYLKGVEWLKSVDGEDLHKEILSLGYKLEPISDINRVFTYLKLDKSSCKSTFPIDWMLNLVLPAKKSVTVSAYNPSNCMFHRAGAAINYDRSSGKAFVTSKNFRQALKEIKKALLLIRQINKNYDEVKFQYRGSREDITNLTFWNEYLGLE